MENRSQQIWFARWLLRIRPAPLGSAMARLLRLTRRRLVETPEGLFYVNPVSNFGMAMLQGSYEPEMTDVLRTFLHEGATFIDLGANEGFFSIVASRLVGSRGQVIAVEPQSRLQSVVLKNLEINGCYNVRLIRCIISDQSGVGRLMIAPETNTGSSGLFRATRYWVPSEQVPSLTLCELLQKTGILTCDLLKMDVEGAEFEIVMSSRELLKRGVIRNLAIEFHDTLLTKRGLRADTIREQLAECGFTLVRTSNPTVYTFRS